MLIAFVHNGKAFLPGIDHYKNFFWKRGIVCEEVTPARLSTLDAQVAWFFMGTDFKKRNIVTIHEYRSASVPPNAAAKDFVKRFFNSRPRFRLFLNEYVKDKMNFQDGVPFGLRDVGVEMPVVNIRFESKQYDFIYVGDTSPSRRIEILLDKFVAPPLSTRTILILSKDYEKHATRYRHAHNIIFKGPVPYFDVQRYVCQARFAINFIPNIEPFNHQTSSKLLEYCACKVPVITTRYRWVEEFERNYGGAFFYLDEALSNLTLDNLERFEFAFPNMSSFSWEQRILNSGILEFLQQQFGKF